MKTQRIRALSFPSTTFDNNSTAKANGLDPFGYLVRLFEKLPQAKDDEGLHALLPQYIERDGITPYVRKN